MKHRLVLARPVVSAVIERARRDYDAIIAEENDMTRDELLAAVETHQAEAIFFSSNLTFDKPTIDALPASVKIAATCSVGFDHIDVPAAKARGLVVTNTPEVLTDGTADLAFMLIMAVCRRAREYDAIVRQSWTRHFRMNEMLGVEVTGKRLGIYGMGRIGRAVAKRARGFDMQILYHDVQRLPPELEQGATYYADFREMLPHCDILTLHAPGGDNTDKIMNRETFALLPKGAVFVNDARGTLVDEDALVETLRSGHLFGAGIDVFRAEPTPNKALTELPNVLLSPHMGSATVETREAMGFRALENIDRVMAGQPPRDPLWR
jgi:lactate dehydrogenase-like 2-hydroxyacid dehydrogenase